MKHMSFLVIAETFFTKIYRVNDAFTLCRRLFYCVHTFDPNSNLGCIDISYNYYISKSNFANLPWVWLFPLTLLWHFFEVMCDE